jgi:2-methylcitrate dehydratase PrpD
MKSTSHVSNATPARTAETSVTGPSTQLAEFASNLQFKDLPAATVARAKLCMLDAIGCATFATTLEWGRVLTEYTVAMGGDEQALIWGTTRRVPAANAALVNGTLIHGFELDDLHKKSIVHPSCVAVPAALAICEGAPRLTGADLLTAVVAGFEVGVRAGMSIGTSHLVKGFHPTGTSGAVAAAAAAGRAKGLRTRAMEHAISIGASQAAGLMSSQHESMVKRMHAGRAAQSGVYAAELAARGFEGIDGVFETEYGGYCSTFSDHVDMGVLTAGLGAKFETDVVGFKIYSCCGSTQTSVEAIKKIRAHHELREQDVERVDVRASTATLLHVGWPYHPKSITTAQMNLPYCLAVTLIDGNAFVEQFTEAMVNDPTVVALAKRVFVTADPTIDQLGPSGRHRVTVTVKLRDGSEISETVAYAKGSDADPLRPDEVVAKFHRLAEPIVGTSWAKSVYSTVMAIEAAPSVASLSKLLSMQHSH